MTAVPGPGDQRRRGDDLQRVRPGPRGDEPRDRQPLQPDDLNVIDWNDYRVAMLQDAIFARKAWLDQGGNEDIAVRFLRASLKGWIYCRDHPDDCVQYTTDAGTSSAPATRSG